MIIFYSLILFGLVIFRIKKIKLSKDKIIKFLIISIVLAILSLLLSVFYQEKNVGGMCVWHHHGLPHYYLTEGKCFENERESQRLWNSKDIFLERDFSRLINGISFFYFAVDFIFWTLLFFFLIIFIASSRPINFGQKP